MKRIIIPRLGAAAVGPVLYVTGRYLSERYVLPRLRDTFGDEREATDTGK